MVFYPPRPGGDGAAEGCGAVTGLFAGPVENVAVTVRSCDMSRTHGSVPVQAPLHPENVDPTLGVATSRTAELLGYALAHIPVTDPVVIEHEICGVASGAVTVPEPTPFPCTRSTCCVAAGVPVGAPPSVSPTQPAAETTATTTDTAARALVAWRAVTVPTLKVDARDEPELDAIDVGLAAGQRDLREVEIRADLKVGAPGVIRAELNGLVTARDVPGLA